MRELQSVEFTSTNKTEIKKTFEDGTIVYQPTKLVDKQVDLFLEGKSLAKHKYDLIVSYDQEVVDYNESLLECDICDIQLAYAQEGSISCKEQKKDCISKLTKPKKPEGYYTEDEVEASLLLHAEWAQCISDGDFDKCGIEPEVKELPIDLPKQELSTTKVVEDYKIPLRVKRNTINKERNDKYANLKVEFKGYNIDAHERARGEITGAVTNILASKMAGLPDDVVTWTTADDEDIDFTYDEIIQLGNLILVSYADIHKKSRTDKKGLK